MSKPRIDPLPRAEWTREIVATMDPMIPPEGSAMRARREEMDSTPVVNALSTLLRHPALAGAFFQFNRHLLYESALTERERELAILRVAHHRGCGYEWAQHVVASRQAGITDDEIDRLRRADGGAGWSPEEQALVAAVDELMADATIEDATWATLSEARGEQWLMDLVFTIGGYETLAYAFNSFGVELDPGLERYL